VRLWEVATGQCLRVFQGHTNLVESVSLSADGRWALSRSDDAVWLWEVATGQREFSFDAYYRGEAVNSVSLSVDGRWVLSVNDEVEWYYDKLRDYMPMRGTHRPGSDSTVRLWEVGTGRCLRTFQGHMGEVRLVCLSADGRWALSESEDRTIRLWEVATGQCLRVFEGHTDNVTSVCLSADGRWALSGSEDRTIRLWEVATGQCLRVFEGHTDNVTSVCLSADGRWALSGSRDHTIRLWEVAAGQCLRTFQGHTGPVWSVSLSADSRWVLSGSGDQTVRLWELDWELEARDFTEWDEGALPYLEVFLTQHTPYAGGLPQDREPSEEEVQQALTRRGKPSWTEGDFQDLIRQLQYAGYGWLRPEGVRRKLEEMAASWQGPPPLPGTRDTSVQQAQEPASIGMAWMEEDGTIVLLLRAETNGMVGHAHFDYPPNHPEYAEILEHLGGLVPGEQKSVKPWPETS
jgi:hypothetical protein